MRSWKVKTVFEKNLQVRLTDEGILQKRKNGRWVLMKEEPVDLGMVTVQDIEDSLKGMPGVVKVTRAGG